MKFIESYSSIKHEHPSAFYLDSPPSYHSMSPERGSIKNCRCNILLQNGECLDAKLRKRKQIKEKLRQRRDRLEKLSQPKRRVHFIESEKSTGKPLDCLLPRLTSLAEPKIVTPKYQKPKEEPIVLPGCIKNWEAHKVWLELRAKPKQQCTKEKSRQSASRIFSRKITADGLKRILRLATPRTQMQFWNLRPQSKRIHNNFAMASARFCKLSEPRVRADIDLEHRPLSQVLKVSKSAMTYEASERIHRLAVPKRGRLTKRKEKVHCSRQKSKCFCCIRSISCEDNLFNDSSSRERQLTTA